MKFHTYGDKINKKVLLIHAMGADEKSFKPILPYLEKHYYVIIPTLDGHYKGSKDYMSDEAEVMQILGYLKQEGIHELEMVLGTSMGATLAFELYLKHQIRIKKLIMDGGPFFHFGKLLQKLSAFVFIKIVDKVNEATQKDPEHKEKHSYLYEMMRETCPYITKATLQHIASEIYRIKLPKKLDTSHTKVIFMYGSEEPARWCLHRIDKYKDAKIIMMRGYGHCEYLVKHPQKYVRRIESL